MNDPYSSIPVGLARHVPSGRAPIAGLAMGLGAGVIAVFVLAVVYAYSSIYMPIVQISLFLTMGYGASIGGITAVVMRNNHVRNRVVTVGAAVVLSVFAWFVAWYPWLYAIFNRAGESVGVLDLLNPFLVIGALSSIYDSGTWSMGSHSSGAVKGVFLGIVWVAELGGIVGCGLAAALAITKDTVFCEACESWCMVLPALRPFPIDSGPALREALLNSGNMSVLAPRPDTIRGHHWLVLKVAFCEKCGETNVVALDEVKESVDRRGRSTQSTKVFVPFHVVSRSDMEKVRKPAG